MNNNKQYLKIQFLKFLKKKQAYYRYLKYSKFTDKTLKKFLEFTTPYNYVDAAFLWGCTNEGKPYWEKIHQEWDSFVEKIKGDE